MQENGELHPNWRALSTVHIPYKIFLAEGTSSSTNLEPKSSKYKIQNVSGTEAKEFYENTIKTKSESVIKETRIRKINRKSENVKYEKLRFNKMQYFRAATENNVEILKSFQYTKDDINTTDEFGWTALMMAACEGAENSVEYLLQIGINSDASDRSGSTALSLAKRKGFTNIVKKIIEKNVKHKKCHSKNDTEIKETLETFFCDICNLEFVQISRKKHDTSTVHQFNRKNLYRKNSKRFNIAEKNRGLKIMIKQGWDRESGLGPNNKGHLYPIKTVIRKQRTGLGVKQDSAKITHFKSYDVAAIKYHPQPRDKIRKELNREQIRERRKEKSLRKELS